MDGVTRMARRWLIAVAAATLTLATAACNVPVDADATSAPAAPAAGSPSAAVLASARASTAGLVQPADLGRDRGAGEQVRSAATTLATLATNLTSALKAAQPSVDLSPSPDLAATVRDLGARSGSDFDPAWLRAASDLLTDLRTSTAAVLASPDVPDAVKDAVRAAVGDLDAAQNALRATGTTAGAAAPTQVQAGDGGVAGDRSGLITVLGIALVGLGGALLGGAATRRRARR